MIYYVSALKNDKSRLLMKEARTSCAETLMMIVARWTELGFITNVTKED